MVDEEVRTSPYGQMDPAMAADPRAFYKMLRENAPVMAVEGAGVIVARYAETDVVLHDPVTFSSKMGAVDLKNIRPLIPLQIDPPQHRTFRKILDPLFAPKPMALLEAPITVVVNELIDACIAASADGPIDFTAMFAMPFPSRVFLELFGVPIDDLVIFLAMKDGIIRPDHASGTEWGSPEAEAHQVATAESIYEYFTQVIADKEANPGNDLISQFLTAEIDGSRLTHEDILDICFLFLIAGLDTVTATLTCMFGYLTSNPEQRDLLVADPSLIPSAIEEMLRWETPVMGIARIATADTELNGCPVAKGQQVSILIGSANTDEADLADAGTVRFERDSRRHLAFGGGVHRCLGSHLARLELRVALAEWHRRIPTYSVPEGEELVYTPGIRTVDRFPMLITPA